MRRLRQLFSHAAAMIAIVSLCPSHASAQPLTNPFAWVVPALDTDSVSDFPFPIETPAGTHGFVNASADGHFQFDDGTRVRFWGTTISGSAVFPDSADAIIQAARLRKFGFNSVRFYNYDNHNFSGTNQASIIAAASQSPTTQVFDSVQLKKFDFFVAQLKRNGIYLNLTFHIQRGFRAGDSVFRPDSLPTAAHFINYADARIQDLQKQFMLDLFNHLNPFTGVAYKNDPVVAMVELTDQDALMNAFWNDNVIRDSTHKTISFYRAQQLDTLFNQFLKAKYGSTAQLAASWNNGTIVSQTNFLPNGSFEKELLDWNFTENNGNTADTSIITGGAPDGAKYLLVKISAADSLTTGITLSNSNCRVYRDSLYDVSFMAKTVKPAGRNIKVNASFGLTQTLHIDTSWKTYSFIVRPTSSNAHGVVNFYLSSETGNVLLDAVAVRRAGENGLAKSEAIENYSVHRSNAAARLFLTNARLRDEVGFYDSLDRAYCTSMRAALRVAGVHAPMSGTNTPSVLLDALVSQEMDFISSPGTWDGYTAYSNDSTWTIGNTAIVNHRYGPLTRAMFSAVARKPMVLSQYYHIYPNAYQTESMLHLPAYAALMDYDAVYWYYYAADKTTYNAQLITPKDLYELQHNPAMLALSPVASAMFREGMITPSATTIALQHTPDDFLLLPKYSSSRNQQYGIIGGFATGMLFISGARIDSMHATTERSTIDYDQSEADSTFMQSDTRELNWDAGKRGVLWIDNPRVQGATGFLNNALATSTHTIDATRLDTVNFGTYLWISCDTTPLANAAHSLLVLSGRAQNSGTVWNKKNNSVGKLWGAAPTQIEPMHLAFNFRGAGDTMMLYPLDSVGHRTAAAIGATKNYRGEWRVDIDQSKIQTPWFAVDQIFSGTSTASRPLVPTSDAINIFPNPFSDHARISISTADDLRGATLTVFDQLGRSVADLSALLHAGSGLAIDFDRDELPAGNYTCVFTTPQHRIVKSFILMQ